MPDVKPRPQNSSMKKSRGTMRRLRDSEAGNVAIMTAAAIVPLIALIGSAVDISRLYLTKTRLQQACDAGVLAARKSMVGNNWSEEDNGAIANEFFRANFPEGKYGTGTLKPNYRALSDGAVEGTATVAVPMTLMSFFGVGDQGISVTCTADLQLPNTDIMFVLDTTESMMQMNEGEELSRLYYMKEAVKGFHKTIEDMKPVGSHIRYGFVPFSSTVNVGALLKPEWIVSKAQYNSRVKDTPYISTLGNYGPTRWNVDGNRIYRSGTTKSSEDTHNNIEKCFAPADTFEDIPDSWRKVNDISQPNVGARECRLHTKTGTQYIAKSSNGVCTITGKTYINYKEDECRTLEPNPDHGKPIPDKTYLHWKYKLVDYELDVFKDGGPSINGKPFIEKEINDDQSLRTITWDGCIEERATRRSGDDSGPRHDMDVDTPPNTADPSTQWRPYLPDLVYGRAVTDIKNAQDGKNLWQWVAALADDTVTKEIDPLKELNYYSPRDYPRTFGACPTYARQLAEISDPKELRDYLDQFSAAGYTYLDIGFLWGVRLMSRQGLFATEHALADGKNPASLHLIFMTDGEADTKIGAYDAWGLSAMDRRRTPANRLPTDEEQNKITNDRLAELCGVAKGKGITVWVIAFGTELTTELKKCASDGRAFSANNSEELNKAFADIASQIASLRITS